MLPNQKMWARSRDSLGRELEDLGYPFDLADVLAKNLGSPKAIDRMASYVRQAKPQSLEMIIDEMLGICEEIEAWRRKKQSEEANARYYEMRNEGFGQDDDPSEETMPWE